MNSATKNAAMKNILYAIMFISLTEVTNAQVIGGGLTGSATRMLQVNSSGELIPLAPGSSSQVLFGNGTWGSLPYSTSGGNTIFPTGSVGIGNSNPQKTLDVTGTMGVSGDASIGGSLSLASTLRISSLTSGGSLTPLYVDINGNLTTGARYPGQINFGDPCGSYFPWTIGGNYIGSTPPSGTDLSAGTCDNHPFILKSNNVQSLFLVPSGGTAISRVGIGTASPLAMLHVRTVFANVGTPTPGFIVDDENPSENSPEYIINSDGTTRISIMPPGNGFQDYDMFSVNTQDPHFTQLGNPPAFYNIFRIDRFTGNVGIGVAPDTKVNAYKMLTVNGDVSLANYSTSGVNANASGLNGIEILGGDQVPTRRGIATDNDPNGDMNFYINGNQITSEFNFKNGTDPNYHNYSSGAAAPTLMSIAANGQVTIGGHPPLPGYHDNSKLRVFGDITTTAVYVTDPNTKWSDFVFDSNYKLMSLPELEKFYLKNHHLPEVPTTKDIQTKGNDLAGTDAILLQKIEELTLYVVQQQKEIDNLKKELKKNK